jgi:hypothetical protein
MRINDDDRIKCNDTTKGLVTQRRKHKMLLYFIYIYIFYEQIIYPKVV